MLSNISAVSELMRKNNLLSRNVRSSSIITVSGSVTTCQAKLLLLTHVVILSVQMIATRLFTRLHAIRTYLCPRITHM